MSIFVNVWPEQNISGLQFSSKQWVSLCLAFTKNNMFCVFKGSVKVWDPRQKNDPVATMEPKEGETKRDCWSVAFGMITDDNFETNVQALIIESHCLQGL